MKPRLLSRISSFLIDISIIYTASILTNNFIPLNPIVGVIQIFLLISFLYFLISYSINGYTPGKYLLQIKLCTRQKNKPGFLTLLKRELLYKYLFVLISALIIYVFCKKSSSLISRFVDFNTSILIVAISGLLVSIIIWIFFRTTWWDALSNTKIEKTVSSRQKLKLNYFLLILFFGVSYFMISYLNNRNQNSDLSFLGFEYPQNFKSHALNAKVKNHIDFLETQHSDPKDYIIELFTKYDIVILCEWNHREITQWDFVSELVKDKRFINQVGNVFTEYGASSEQAQLDSLLNRKFHDEESLNRETSKLMCFMNSGFHNFIKTLNKLNTELPDSLKIHEHFTDLDIYHEYIPTSANPYRMQRDSMMAARVINSFNEIRQKENRKKCLVITNFRHAFGVVEKNGKEIDDFKKNEARYIFKAFPEKTANVLINCLAMKKSQAYYPVNDGIWDRAFSEINNSPLGFDLKNTPFGRDRFDLFPWSKTDLNYEDVFTGFLFIKPVTEKEYNKYYPGREYGAEMEYLTKHSSAKIDSADLNNTVLNYRFNEFSDKTFWVVFHGLYNAIPLVVYILLLGIVSIVILYHLIRISLTKEDSVVPRS